MIGKLAPRLTKLAPRMAKLAPRMIKFAPRVTKMAPRITEPALRLTKLVSSTSRLRQGHLSSRFFDILALANWTKGCTNWSMGMPKLRISKPN